MGHIFTYSVVSGVLLALMYLVYKLMLASEKQHEYNRAVIWTIYATALVLPAVLPLIPGLFNTQTVAAGAIAVGTPAVTLAEDHDASVSLLPTIFVIVYYAGAAVAGAIALATAVRLKAIINCGERYRYERFTLVVHDSDGLAPFSWKNYVVMNRKDFEESREVIIAHETCHIESAHWVDLLIAQLVIVLQWYNPASWLMREELKAVHEYQADEAVVQSGSDIKQYQMLLIKKAVGGRFQSLANSLNHSNLKKRITMMYKSKSTVGRRFRALALAPAALVAVAVVNIPAVASALTSASQALAGGKVTKIDGNASVNGVAISADNPVPDQKIYESAEIAPEYPGGMVEMLKQLSYNLRYPEKAMKDGTEGRVVVRFVVNKTGHIESPEIIRSVSPELDVEALRVVKELSDFTPGKINGKPVCVYYVLPVTFRLSNPEPAEKK